MPGIQVLLVSVRGTEYMYLYVHPPVPHPRPSTDGAGNVCSRPLIWHSKTLGCRDPPWAVCTRTSTRTSTQAALGANIDLGIISGLPSMASKGIIPLRLAWPSRPAHRFGPDLHARRRHVNLASPCLALRFLAWPKLPGPSCPRKYFVPLVVYLMRDTARQGEPGQYTVGSMYRAD